MLLVTKGQTYLNKAASLSWTFCLSMYDFLLPPGIKGLKVILEIFKEQSHKISSVLPAVFFEKVVYKIFRKFLEKHLWQSSYSAYLQTFKLVNMLNTLFPQISTTPNSFKIELVPGVLIIENSVDRGDRFFMNVFSGISQNFSEQLC